MICTSISPHFTYYYIPMHAKYQKFGGFFWIKLVAIRQKR